MQQEALPPKATKKHYSPVSLSLSSSQTSSQGSEGHQKKQRQRLKEV